jgi:hypothetical protein
MPVAIKAWIPVHDNTLEFSHLSLQEYLAAVWLEQTHDGHEERLGKWKELTGKPNWWEALRLQAAGAA